MTAKIQRTYRLEVRGRQRLHVLEDPLTLDFDVERQEFSAAQDSKFTLYNLSKSSRDDIFLDRELRGLKDDEILPITFSAGYESQGKQAVIFKGNVVGAYTQRNGSELVTHVQAMDSGQAIANSTVDKPVPAGWDFIGTLKDVMRTLKGVKVGEVSVALPPGWTAGPAVFCGNTWEELQKYVPDGGRLFIDNGTVHLLGQNNALLSTGGLNLLNAKSGLLNIPIKNGNTTMVSCVFEPNLFVGQALTLESSFFPEAGQTKPTGPSVNGLYKVIGIHHHGRISGVDSSQAITDLTLLRANSGTFK